jgi:small basic protein
MWCCVCGCASVLGCGAVSLGVQVYLDVALSLGVQVYLDVALSLGVQVYLDVVLSLGVQVYLDVSLSLGVQVTRMWCCVCVCVCKCTGMWRCVSGCTSLLGCGVVSLGVQVFWVVALCVWVCKCTRMWRCVSGCAIPTFRMIVISSADQTIQGALGRPYETPKRRSLHSRKDGDMQPRLQPRLLKYPKKGHF